MSTELVDYDDFFHRITGYLPSTLPAGLQHFNIRHNPGANWIVLRFSEFKYSQYELHLSKSSSHHKAYFGDGKVDLIAFYYGGSGASNDQRMAWLNTVNPYVELISRQLGTPVVCGEWSENWAWLAMKLTGYDDIRKMAMSYSISLAHFIQATYIPIFKVFSTLGFIRDAIPDLKDV